MFFTVAILYTLLASTMNLTSPMNYISPNNFTTSTIIYDSVNYTQKMFQSMPSFSSFTMEPYRNQFFLLKEHSKYNSETIILFTYAMSFFVVASMIYCFASAPRTQTIYIKAYTYESDEEDDMDYTDSLFSRERSKSWRPHPMVRRSMVSSHHNK
jgi:hypothetical protein